MVSEILRLPYRIDSMATVQISRFLRLPAELRNTIYSLTLHDGSLDIDQQEQSKGGSPPPGIVLACKQTFMESLVMYYTNLKAVSRNTCSFNKWLLKRASLEQSHPLRLVKKIDLDCRNYSEKTSALSLGQQFALSHHSQLAINYVHTELRARGAALEDIAVRACLVSPSQLSIWTSSPFECHCVLADRWNGKLYMNSQGL